MITIISVILLLAGVAAFSYGTFQVFTRTLESTVWIMLMKEQIMAPRTEKDPKPVIPQPDINQSYITASAGLFLILLSIWLLIL